MPEKATITNTVTGTKVPVMFNPEEYSVNRENNFAQTAIPGLSAPILQFVHGNMQTLEMELFLDTYETHRNGSRTLNQAGQDVRELTSQITGFLDIDPTTHAPPVLVFTWASLSFTCVLARANQRFTMFLPSGIPVRAKMQVTFNEFRNIDLEAKEIKRETADYSKIHVVNEGERLDSIAMREYSDPTLWRPIALMNNVDNPFDLVVGTPLLVPQLPYLDPTSGEIYQ
ncbi:MAG TPA: peptigoglycan-binding protein LysM [Verrucomicrobiae bacterium]|nr:peptigoglycan-binding protein LysM [Verrucomicrobiae bacterium]